MFLYTLYFIYELLVIILAFATCGKGIIMSAINISPGKQTLIVCFILTTASLAIYLQVNQFSFINADDTLYVTENILVRQGISLDGIRWAFTSISSGFLYPLTWLSLMLDFQLYGLHAGGYHLTNLILHVLSALMLFLLFCRMTGMIWRSAFVAFLFALHPVNVESFAWVSERKDVLCAFFWMLTLYSYVRYTEKPVIKRYLPVLFFFICALMSKPMAVTLPAVMILLDYWPLERFKSGARNMILMQLKEKFLFFILSAVFCAITLYAWFEPYSGHDYSLIFRLSLAPVSFLNYLGKLFWPCDFAIIYPYPETIPSGRVLLSLLFIFIISTAAIILARRFKYLLAGWLWYAVTVLPILGITKTGTHFIHDHYIYLPSLGISIMLAWGIPSLIKEKNVKNIILFPAAITFLVIISFMSLLQCSYWKNSVEVFNHALKATNDNVLAHAFLSYALYSDGKFEDAIYHCDRVILLQTNQAGIYNNRGNAYFGLGRKKRAAEDYSAAIRLRSDYAEAYYNRAAAYIDLGQHMRAVRDYTKIVIIKPDFVQAYLNRGFVYSRLGILKAALADYSTAISLKPDYVEAYVNRGAIYLNQGNTKKGCADARKACALGDCIILNRALQRKDCG